MAESASSLRFGATSTRSASSRCATRRSCASRPAVFFGTGLSRSTVRNACPSVDSAGTHHASRRSCLTSPNPSNRPRKLPQTSSESSLQGSLRSSSKGSFEGLPRGAGQGLPHRSTLGFGRGSRLRFSHRSRQDSPGDQGQGTPADSPSSSSDGFRQSLFHGQLDGSSLDRSLEGVLSCGSCA